ncbi:MAG: ABC transporter substrate-binding protein [Armatimonadetes bacterium]|nr:ABC transporter substrate-binding protein [Armatimonadota bacterium]
MFRRALVLLSVLAIALAGCSKPMRDWGGYPREFALKSAVSLSPGATEIVRQKTPNIAILGLTAECNYPELEPKQPKVMKGVKPDYELIASLNPSLVVYDKDLFSDADVQKFKDLGMKTYGFYGKTLEEFADSLYQYGKLAGGETDISEYVSTFLSIADQGRKEPMNPKPKVAIMIPGNGTDPLIAGVNTLQADVVRAAGAEPVGPDATIFVPVNAEWLIKTNPDAIMIAGTNESIEKDPRFQGIAAIKTKRFAHMNQDIALRRGARLDIFVRETRNYLMRTQPGVGGN